MAPKKAVKASRKKAAMTEGAKTPSGKSQPIPSWQAPRLAGKTVCFTGKFDCDRKIAEQLVAREGGTVAKEVKAAVDYLVVGQSRGTGKSGAEKKADSLNQKGASIQILDEDGFVRLLQFTNDELLAMLRAGQPGVKRWNSLFGKGLPAPDAEFISVSLNKADLNGVWLPQITFTDCDFRDANLTQVLFGTLKKCRLDGAELDHAVINSAEDCSFRRCGVAELGISERADRCDFRDATGDHFRIRAFDCDFRNLNAPRMWLYEATRCNFTAAKMPGSNFGLNRTGGYVDNVFDEADLSDGKLRSDAFPGSSLIAANLEGADLSRAKFPGAVLARACLHKADLTDVDLSRADLSGADLREARLTGANLGGAKIDGADFTGAIVSGTNFDHVDVSQAKGLDSPDATTAIIGPRIRALEAAAAAGEKWETSLSVLIGGKPHKVQVKTYTGYHGRQVYLSEMVDDKRQHSWDNHTSLGEAIVRSAARANAGEPDLTSVRVSRSKCPLKPKDAKQIALAAWCEAFGVETPDVDALKQLAKQGQAGQQEQRDEWLAKLRSGPDGIAQWNALTRGERQHIGQFRGVDFSKVDLTSADLSDVDLRDANLSGASLSEAQLWRADFRKANLTKADLREVRGGMSVKFSDADLSRANFSGSDLSAVDLQRANLQNAKLNKTRLRYADLRGTNLTGAQIKGCVVAESRYDEATVFPEGFDIPEEMIWAGQGADPRLEAQLEPVEPDDIDMETFHQRLELTTDTGRLQKALKMLKAERFQLFADVESTSLAGVVKSQSDADLVYSCHLDGDGAFACCTQNLNPCGGLRGALCKHLLVLIVGLVQQGELEPGVVDTWVSASRRRKPALDKDRMSALLLKYKGAEAGEIDWRPTETVPEDFYAY